MTEIVEMGRSIEGKRIKGQSREQLRNRGMENLNGQIVQKYTAKRDVRSQVIEPVLGAELLPGSSVDPADEIICQSAVIYTTAKGYSPSVAKGSASHRTNKWTFSDRTAVRVSMSHSGIASAIASRQRREIGR